VLYLFNKKQDTGTVFKIENRNVTKVYLTEKIPTFGIAIFGRKKLQ